jgi:hypothetical protein
MLIPIGGAFAQQPIIVKYTPNMTVQSLAGRPDTDIVELRSGRHVTVGDVRRLDAVMQKLRAPKVDRTPAAFAVNPAATGRQLHNSHEIAEALARANAGETVRLPSGRLVTIGQLRAVQPLVEEKLGYKLDSALRPPNLSGPAIKFTRPNVKTITLSDKQALQAQWQDILKNQPDDKVLESPSGIRVTVGQAKQYLTAKVQSLRRRAPGTAPTRTLSPAAQKQKERVQ